jgi:hypothetical protein
MIGRSSLAAGIISLAVASSPALALSARTFVLGTGTTDAGACTLTEPCRTFAYALTQTSPSGEIIVLGSGGYGALTINKAVSIINTSNFAGVTVASGNGITISAGTTDAVTLRGLTIDGGGVGANGIVYNSGASLTIDQCNVMNFVGSGSNGSGILIQPLAGSNSIIITNTIATNNVTGVFHNPPSGSAITEFVIDHLTANKNTNGIYLNNVNSSGAASASIGNSIASGNVNNGFQFAGVGTSLDSSYASGNQLFGIIVSGTNVFLGRTVIQNNQAGIEIISGAVFTYKNNQLNANGTDIAFAATLTPASLQ